ncbi:FmdE family protein [Alicyclobacillus ferrooxydans]|uniref:Formylmethanofuran dehydrogenase n=1 Tax=Alicyclobacillus ferrooxydans TaxID=471514 RepID=A0A0P9EKY5_9BACL|nr:FmdE family protein [Alicyclobacillus ferrooxydans]KPV43863.1 formylmethanofuran dehydrogenase [Alicyclobacillus ferrooxydans]
MAVQLQHETHVSEEELKAAQYFHGHKCPAVPQGLRAAHLAMDILGVNRARSGGELKAIVELGEHHFSGCFADGIQFATGCTFGKGNIVKNPLGKFAVTLVDPRTRRAVRVAVKYDRMMMCLDMPFFEQRKKGIPPYEIDPKDVDPLIQDVISHDWHDMFDVTTFENYPVQKASESFDAVQCVDCKEMVVSNYAVALNGEFLCKTCFSTRVHRKEL